MVCKFHRMGAVRYWMASADDSGNIAGDFIKTSAATAVALFLMACGTSDSASSVTAPPVQKPGVGTISLVTAQRSPASKAHCEEVAAERAGDVKMHGYEQDVQDRVRQSAFAECMRWAPP